MKIDLSRALSQYLIGCKGNIEVSGKKIDVALIKVKVKDIVKNSTTVLDIYAIDDDEVIYSTSHVSVHTTDWPSNIWKIKWRIDYKETYLLLKGKENFTCSEEEIEK